MPDHGATHYTADIHRRAASDLKREPPDTQDAFWAALEALKKGPFPSDNPARIKHLKGQLHCLHRWKLTSGREAKRILYDVDRANMVIHILDFGPRGDIYRPRS